MKLNKCSMCGKRKGIFCSIYLTKDGKMQCTKCANAMRIEPDYFGKDPLKTMKKGQRKTCTNIDCPERRSVCCDAPCVAVTGTEGTGHYECAKCQKEFVGKPCTSKNI